MLSQSSSIVKVESRLEKKSQKIDKILRTVQALNLGLGLLVLFTLLCLLVEDLLVSDLSHFLWIAILDVEWILLLEKDISSKLFGSLALILLLEVDEGLLSAWHDLDLGHFTTAASCAEIDLELLLSGSNRELFDEQAEVHD